MTIDEIKNLKAGDKIYCIKTFYEAIKRFKRKKYLKKLEYITSDKFFDLTEKDKCKFLEEIERSKKSGDFEVVLHELVTKDKIYTIIDKLGPELTIKNEKTKVIIDISKNNNDYNNENLHSWKNANFLTDHFVNFNEGRKIKIEELKEKSFNEFLKNLKNKIK